jgi:folate-binding protein YgfZ
MSVATLLPWSVISVAGPDASTFLQGQVTTDMRELVAGQSRPGCLLNLKGRIETNFYICPQADGFLLVVDSSLQAPAMTRLKKYGVFSKVEITASPLQVVGHLNPNCAALTLPEQSNQYTSLDGAYWLRLHGQNRFIQLCPPEKLDVGITSNADDLAMWFANSISSGDWLIDSSAQGLYQPQELDAHTLQGVSYQKGCYLGQEIVARLYFRGQLKTSLKCLKTSVLTPLDIAPRQAVLVDDKPVGEVVAYVAAQGLALAIVRNEHDDVQITLANADTTHWQAQAFIR